MSRSDHESAAHAQIVELEVNGRSHTLLVGNDAILVDVLREDLGLSGAKDACRMGNCGACTVHLDGLAIYSCLTLAAECANKPIRTIEGMAQGGELSAVQQAFVEADALQCGYCTPGQIMSLEALLRVEPAPDDDQIIAALAGNLCRCGAYRHILAAARRAIELHAARGDPTHAD